MRTVLSVCAFACLLNCSEASAQSDAQSKRPTSPPSNGVAGGAPSQYDEYLHARITTWFEDCRKLWNATSHMTEREHERTCLKMARERIKVLEDQAKGTRPK